MRLAIALVLVANVAYAAPATPPAGWTIDKSLAAPPAAARFGGASTRLTVVAYRAPAPGAVLYVNHAEADIVADQRDRIATLELDEPRNAMKRQPGATSEQDTQTWDAAQKQLDTRVSWKDATVRDHSRAIIASDGKTLVVVTGQCVIAADATPELVTACDAALATLDAEIPLDKRVALAIVAGTTADPVISSDRPQLSPDRLDDGHKISLPPMALEPPKPEPDRRPVYLGGGIVVLAALFYWNRQRREKFERDEGVTKPRRRRAKDEDADDLHAAAEASDDGDDDQPAERRARSNARGDAKVDDQPAERRARSSAQGDAKVDDKS